MIWDLVDSYPEENEPTTPDVPLVIGDLAVERWKYLAGLWMIGWPSCSVNQ